ncbi:hypothetical protein GGF46_000722 [Coemansia sp. RSA 552]|nr:hypothetical protein GGF46_000722 [Coemansia sp. RSA 552]
MGFISKAFGRRSKQGLVSPLPQDHLDAGRPVAQGITPTSPPAPPDGAAHYSSAGNAYAARAGAGYGQPQQPQQHYPRQYGDMAGTVHGDDDFDDAASYHSISSNLGMPQPASIRANDSYYGAPAEENYFRSAGLTPDTGQGPSFTPGLHLSEQFAQASRVSSQMLSPSSVYSNDRPTAAPARQAERAIPASAQEQGEDCFQKAVRFHEEGDLVSATAYFKRAADQQNPMGMLFYGLSLRHGWGCQANEHMAFVFLQKAGEVVVPQVKDMDAGVAGMAREELAMAIYELGQSYRHGWGVSRNKKTAAYYFEVAADLGDADAQADLAACYEKGDGVKRDMKRAAHYYRLAHAQGIELFGTSWIFKKKYDSEA